MCRPFPWFGAGPTLPRAAEAGAENSQLAVLAPAAGKLWMSWNRNHEPPQGPREAGWGLPGVSFSVWGTAFPSSGRGREAVTSQGVPAPCGLVLVWKGTRRTCPK